MNITPSPRYGKGRVRYHADELRARLLKCSRVDEQSPLLRGVHCRVWLKGKTTFGHGQIWDGAKLDYAHRLALELLGGGVTQWALRHCDRPACIEPKHLYDGTPVDNARDVKVHGRRR